MNLLFLGASNTDCGHCFTPDNLGNGFVKQTARLLHAAFAPGSAPIHVINGGTDGFTFPRIYRKWAANWRGTAFDLVCILGGINEVGALMDSGCTRKAYDACLDDSEAACSHLLSGLTESGCKTILILEPFLFSSPDYLNVWQPCLKEVRERIRRAAAPFSAPCLPTQPVLDTAVRKHGLSAVTPDGIHLTETGHRILAEYLVSQMPERLFLP